MNRLFQDPQDEVRLCQVLKALVEEWGPDAVTVSVPKDWEQFGCSTIGKVRLDYSTYNNIAVSVRSESVHINYQVPVFAAS